MPHVKGLDRRTFSEAGPLPQVLHVGEGLVSMLICLAAGQEVRAPADDVAETVFTILSGRGRILEGDDAHAVGVGDVVHVPAGTSKALLADESLAVVGVRRLRSSA